MLSNYEMKRQYISQVMDQMPDDAIMRDFASQLLYAMFWMTIRKYPTEDLAKFAIDVYAFFESHANTTGGFRLFKATDHYLGRLNKYVIQLVYPDAPNILFTLESVLNAFDIRLTRKMHPVFAVRRNAAGAIEWVGSPDEKSKEVYSMIYVEFDPLLDEGHIQELIRKLSQHMAAVQCVRQDISTILESVEQVKTILAGSASPFGEDPAEWINLMDWLGDDNFSFFGYCQFSESFCSGQTAFQFVPQTGLGILSDAFVPADHDHLQTALKSQTWDVIHRHFQYVFDRIQLTSPINRFEDLMMLSLVVPESEDVKIQHVFVGILRSQSAKVKMQKTPLLDSKLAFILDERNIRIDTYNYSKLMHIMDAIPKFELFRLSSDNLNKMVERLFLITNPNAIYCFQNHIEEKNRLQVIIVIPPTLYNHTNRDIITTLVKSRVPHIWWEVVPVRGDELVRLHYYFDLTQVSAGWELDDDQVVEEIRQLTRPWSELLREALLNRYPGEKGDELYRNLIDFIPAYYSANTEVEQAVIDLNHVQHLGQTHALLVAVTTENPDSQVSQLRIYSQNNLHLIKIMPVLENLGLYVLDENTTCFQKEGVIRGYLHLFTIQDKNGNVISDAEVQQLIEAVIIKVLEGATENDPTNALSLVSRLNWREINLLQTYRNLLVQVQKEYTAKAIDAALCRYPESTRLLVDYFTARFSLAPEYGSKAYRESELLPQLNQQFMASLKLVQDYEDDQVFRRLFALIRNTLRTNYFIPRPQSQTAISIKLDSRGVKFMPVPVPYREIYVHDVGVEALHLRFGPIARGGLRWSNRPDDFRTEILGLVKTQQVKNVVIVPVGSKGGFITKNAEAVKHDPSGESKKQYQIFIQALLDISDNVVGGNVISPNHIIAYDELDPYLVVAADKGTATFSDFANEVSERNKFWLDDAFASGGKVGYDHKVEAITARGAWECVKLHFRERGIDADHESITIVGVGDMSGDVFGNGLLRSPYVQLVAAFNHQHIFLDPNPDPAISFQERKRMFELPRSTWREYNTALISTGGGIFDRKSKEITLSPEIQSRLGTALTAVTGDELVTLILKMKADLLWLGGIGTYIKSIEETAFQVGDPANDSVRIVSSDCRFSVIGEGANLGITPLARIELNQMGVSLNSDAVDNSAGVNMSDYEVNLKILMQLLMEKGVVADKAARNIALKAATDEVSELVLKNNRGQHRLISMDVLRSKNQMALFNQVIGDLIESGELNARSEFIPDDKTLRLWTETGQPLPRSVIGIIQAYVKMRVYDALRVVNLCDQPCFSAIYSDYFPPLIRSKFGDYLKEHQLRNDILANMLTNQLVNQTGCTGLYQLQQATSASIERVVCAWFKRDLADHKSAAREAILAQAITESEKYEQLITLEAELLAQVIADLK